MQCNGISQSAEHDLELSLHRDRGGFSKVFSKYFDPVAARTPFDAATVAGYFTQTWCSSDGDQCLNVTFVALLRRPFTM